MKQINELTEKQYKALLDADILKDVYPEATGNVEEDLQTEKLFLSIYEQFYKDIFPFWESTFRDNVSDWTFSRSDKNKLVNAFKKEKKITSKTAREMLEISGHFSDEWNSKQMSTIVKRLNRLKNRQRSA